MVMLVIDAHLLQLLGFTMSKNKLNNRTLNIPPGHFHEDITNKYFN